jgi:hypothetical protein
MKKAGAATPPEQAAVEEKPPHLIMARDTALGDLRDMLLDTMKHEHNPLPWHMRKESEQKATIERVTTAAAYAVDRLVEIIAAEGRRTMKGKLIKVVSSKGEIQTQVNFDRFDELRHDLFDAQGLSVLLAIADATSFTGTRGDVPINFDQGAMFRDDGPGADLDRRKPPEGKDEPPAEEPPSDDPED